MRSSATRRSRIPTALASSACIALAALAAGARQEGSRGALIAGPDARTQSVHGAAPMDEQERRLDELLAGRDPLAAPAVMDPEVWSALLAEAGVNADTIALGRKLYFDPRLSADDTVSCATCHDVTRGFTDQRMVSEGIDDQLGHRNAPTTLNAVLFRPMFLDGRAEDVADQAGMPILNSVEMGMPDEAAVIAKLRAIPEYAAEFERVFGRELLYDDIGRAIGAFEHTLVFLDSPFDRFLTGDEDAIGADAKHGWELYNGKARCASCHPVNPSDPAGVDGRFHNVGVSARHQDFEGLTVKALAALGEDASEQRLDELAVGTDLSELGRFMITQNYADIGAFRTLQVRNVGITPPYMHDGSLQTLWDVMDHYNKGGEANPFLDGGIEPLALSEDEIDAVVALLFAMTDELFADENRAQIEAQRAKASASRPFRDDDLAHRRRLPFEERVAESAGKTEAPPAGGGQKQ
jgi:cytochrome c peroxidase